jgi:hypothetical protein
MYGALPYVACASLYRDVPSLLCPFSIFTCNFRSYFCFGPGFDGTDTSDIIIRI